MKVYLAGKITGDPNYREKFAEAAKKLEERAGVTVISPAVTPEGLKKADYMRICFAMLESADTAVFLPDWEDSPGAQLEKHWCEYVGKKMVFLMGGCGMIDFEGYYLVPPDQVAYIETRRGGGDAQYGLFLGLSGGKELGVWYRTEEARKAAYTKLARQVEIGKRQDREDILYRLRLIEACINKTDKRTLRIWKQLQQLLHLESEETE